MVKVELKILDYSRNMSQALGKSVSRHVLSPKGQEIGFTVLDTPKAQSFRALSLKDIHLPLSQAKGLPALFTVSP